MFGDRQDDAFQQRARGTMYGFKLGVELLFVDLWVGHHQYLGAGGLIGTWTQFMTGFDLEMDLGAKKSVVYDAKGNPFGGYPAWYAEFGFGVGFGVGTEQQVDPPLDNSEVTDKGFLFEGRVGAGFRLLRRLSLGFVVPVTAGYFFKSGPEAAVNDLDDQYVGMSTAVLINLRFKYTLK